MVCNDGTEGTVPVRHAALHAAQGAYLVKGGEQTPVYAQTLRTLPWRRQTLENTILKLKTGKQTKNLSGPLPHPVEVLERAHPCCWSTQNCPHKKLSKWLSSAGFTILWHKRPSLVDKISCAQTGKQGLKPSRSSPHSAEIWPSLEAAY